VTLSYYARNVLTSQYYQGLPFRISNFQISIDKIENLQSRLHNSLVLIHKVTLAAFSYLVEVPWFLYYSSYFFNW